MSQLTLTSPVGQWVAERPQTARVFESLHIDYCCGGHKPLSKACADQHVDPRQVLQQLQATSTDEEPPGEDWMSAPLTALCDHIEQTHHAYLRSELPRLHELIVKVLHAHGSKHPELAELHQAFIRLLAELRPHMSKEERCLFPAIRKLEQSGSFEFHFGTVANPINCMEHEHDNAGDALARMRHATRGYRVPDDACNTYRVMLDELQRLELDLHRHIHKENNILFPRAIEFEKSRRCDCT